MKTAFFLLVAGCIMYLFCFVLIFKYCAAGFFGYPDNWTSEKAKKIYMWCAPFSVLLLIVSIIIFLIML